MEFARLNCRGALLFRTAAPAATGRLNGKCFSCSAMQQLICDNAPPIADCCKTVEKLHFVLGSATLFMSLSKI